MTSINLHLIDRVEITKVYHKVKNDKFQVVTMKCVDRNNNITDVHIFGNGSNEIKIKEIKE
jgi:hypothetical protein